MHAMIAAFGRSGATLLALGLLTTGLCPAGTARAAAATTRPTATTRPGPVDWGTSKAGLQISLSLPGTVTAGGALKVRLALRNVGSAAVNLPGAEKVFGWLLLIYSREEAYISEKVFPAASLSSWPAKLAGDKTIDFKPTDLGPLGVYPYAQRREVYTAYLKPESGAALAKPTTTLSRKLSAAPARARFVLYIPRKDEAALTLASNVVPFEVGLPKWSQLDQAERKAVVERLLKKFDRDAWAAMSAHGQAVGIGRPIVGDLVRAVRQRNRPGFSRLWLATTLADIRCEESVAELIRLLDDPQGGIRSVVGYHGPKQHSEKLDAAIIERLAGGKDAGTVSYALLGFMVFRRQVPEKLLAASFESKDPRLRATFAAALKNRASDFNVSRLAALLGDGNERVRSAAAKALGAMARPVEPALEGLVKALDRPGDSARKSIADALGQLTGKKMPYEPGADEQAKNRVIQAWKDWLARRKKKDG